MAQRAAASLRRHQVTVLIELERSGPFRGRVRDEIPWVEDRLRGWLLRNTTGSGLRCAWRPNERGNIVATSESNARSFDGTVSVIVPHYNDLTNLSLCLEALKRQTLSSSRVEIIVADNDSPQGVDTIANTIAGRAKLVIVSERGAGAARNGGVAQAIGDILAFTDSDCRPEPQWLAEGVAALKRYDLVGGQVKVLVPDPLNMTPAEAFERVFAFDNEGYVRRRNFSVTANLFCLRAVFDAVGGFRSDVPEDKDWCHRALVSGYFIGYNAAAVVGHPARRTWAELKSKWGRLNREAFYNVRPWTRAHYVCMIKCIALPLTAVFHTPKAILSAKTPTFSGKIAAVNMLFRCRLWRSLDLALLIIRQLAR